MVSDIEKRARIDQRTDEKSAAEIAQAEEETRQAEDADNEATAAVSCAATDAV